MQPTGICNKEGHLIEQGICITCDLRDEPNYAEITKETMNYGIWDTRSINTNDGNKRNNNDVGNTSSIEPKHYTDMAISPHEYNKKNKIPWNESQVIKYVSRWRAKNGLEDLRKAEWYLRDLIKDIENDNK